MKDKSYILDESFLVNYRDDIVGLATGDGSMAGREDPILGLAFEKAIEVISEGREDFDWMSWNPKQPER